MEFEHRGTTVRLVKRGRYYQAVWWDGPTRYRKSTKCERVDEAIAKAKVMTERIHSSETGMRLSAALEKLWDERWKYQNTPVRRTYVEEAVRFLNDPALNDITRDMLLGLKQHWEAKGISFKTVNRRLSAVRAVLNAAYRDWEVMDSPPPRIKLTRERPGRYRYLSDSEIEALFRNAPADAVPVFMFALETGCRRGEIMKLRWRDIDFDHKRLVVPPHICKTDYLRAIPLTDELVAVLEGEMDDRDASRDDLIFPDLTVAVLRRWWMKVRIKMGLEDDPDFVFHALRHTCATRLVNQGVPTSTVQKWLGHTRITTTEHYLNQTGRDLEAHREKASVSGFVSERVKSACHTPVSH